MTENANKKRQIELVASRGLSPRVKSLRFKFATAADASGFGFIPGQFFMIDMPGYGEIPLTITTSPSELPEFELAVRTTGNTTTALNRMKPGEKAYIRGPLGNTANFHSIYGRELIIIAGGIGLAPLRSIIKNIGENSQMIEKLTIVYGAKSPVDLIYKDELESWKKFSEVLVTVDQGDSEWIGLTGQIPKIVATLKPDKTANVIMCGPPPMYQGCAKALIQNGVSPDNIYLMLERRMVCGIGKCQHCTCGEQYVCTDGPTFTYSELANNWEAFM